MANSTQAGASSVPVTAAQPTSTGTAPAAPPITMFWGLRGLSQIVYTKTEKSIALTASDAVGKHDGVGHESPASTVLGVNLAAAFRCPGTMPAADNLAIRCLPTGNLPATSSSRSA